MDAIFINTKNSEKKSMLPGKIDLKTPPKHISFSKSKHSLP